jgi:hypothetical protein
MNSASGKKSRGKERSSNLTEAFFLYLNFHYYIALIGLSMYCTCIYVDLILEQKLLFSQSFDFKFVISQIKKIDTF